jgi:hypothetical protein
MKKSVHYAAYIASIHLVAIRFCMLISAKHNSVAAGFSEVRSSLFLEASFCVEKIQGIPTSRQAI